MVTDMNYLDTHTQAQTNVPFPVNSPSPEMKLHVLRK